MPDFLKFILTRPLVLYLACFLLIWRMLDFSQLQENTIPTTISRLTPPIDYFYDLVDRQGGYDHFKLMDCVNYHQAVAYFFPFQKTDAYGMLGFCYERMGQESQAVAAYTQAIAINPYFFWPYYDLGVIYYRHAQYPQAEGYFQQAVEQDPLKSIVIFSRSKVYNDVLLSKQQGQPYDFLQSLKQGRITAYILMMDCFYKTGNYEQLWKSAIYGIKKGWDTQGIFYYYAAMASYNLKSYKQAMAFMQIASQLHKQKAPAIEEYLNPRVRFF